MSLITTTNSNPKSASLRYIAFKNNVNRDLCIDIRNGWGYNGNIVWLYNCNYGSGQMFYLDGDGRICSKIDKVKCLEAGAKFDLYAKLFLWDCHNGINQKFELTSEGMLRSRKNGRFIDIPGGCGGAKHTARLECQQCDVLRHCECCVFYFCQECYGVDCPPCGVCIDCALECGVCSKRGCYCEVLWCSNMPDDCPRKICRDCARDIGVLCKACNQYHCGQCEDTIRCDECGAIRTYECILDDGDNVDCRTCFQRVREELYHLDHTQTSPRQSLITDWFQLIPS